MQQWFDPLVRKIPWGRAWQPTPLFLPGDCVQVSTAVGDGNSISQVQFLIFQDDEAVAVWAEERGTRKPQLRSWKQQTAGGCQPRGKGIVESVYKIQPKAVGKIEWELQQQCHTWASFPVLKTAAIDWSLRGKWARSAGPWSPSLGGFLAEILPKITGNSRLSSSRWRSREVNCDSDVSLGFALLAFQAEPSWNDQTGRFCNVAAVMEINTWTHTHMCTEKALHSACGNWWSGKKLSIWKSQHFVLCMQPRVYLAGDPKQLEMQETQKGVSIEDAGERWECTALGNSSKFPGVICRHQCWQPSTALI